MVTQEYPRTPIITQIYPHEGLVNMNVITQVYPRTPSIIQGYPMITQGYPMPFIISK